MDILQLFSGSVLDLLKAFLTSATALSVVLLLLNFKLKGVGKEKGRTQPPGPRPWPIVGSLGVLGTLPHRDFEKLSKQYGPILSLRLGSVNTIVVSSAKIAEEILRTRDHVFAGRPKNTQGSILTYGRQALATASYGPYWRYARKVFTLELMTNKRLQQFQSLRKEEVLFTLHSILEDCKMGKAVRMDIKFGQLTKNNITRMLINKSFFGPNSTASTLKEGVEYAEHVKELVRLFGVFNIGDYIPFLQNFDLQGYKKQMLEVRRRNDIFFDKIIDEHRQRLTSTTSEQLSRSDMMDFVDVLLTRLTGVGEQPLTDTQIKAILMEATVAGTDTSSGAMEWVLTELLRHPAAMKRVQDELDAVVGPNRFVEETDIPHLKYFRAAVKETFRLHPVIPLMVPHWSLESCEVAGYHIPVNSQLFINTWAIGRDPASWERPLEFEPTRFLTNNVEYLGQEFEFLPFGSGRRSCPGRNIGILIVEYGMAVLLHACNWNLPPGLSPKDLDVQESLGSTAPKAIPLEAVASPRLPLQIYS